MFITLDGIEKSLSNAADRYKYNSTQRLKAMVDNRMQLFQALTNRIGKSAKQQLLFCRKHWKIAFKKATRSFVYFSYDTSFVFQPHTAMMFYTEIIIKLNYIYTTFGYT